MKRFIIALLLIVAGFSGISVFGAKVPENSAVRQSLASKYRYVYYNEYSGYYEVETSNNMRGLCDHEGNVVFNPGPFSSLYWHKDASMVTFRKKDYPNTQGVMKMDGTIIIDAGKYYSIFPYGDWIEVSNIDSSRPNNAVRGAYSPTGKMIVPCKYDNINQEYKTNFLTAKINGKVGLYNTDGVQIISDCSYDFISSEMWGEKQFFLVKNSDKYGLVNSSGKEIIPCEYKFIRLLDKDESNDILLLSKFSSGVSGKVLIGLAKTDGTIIVPCKYDEEVLPFWGLLKDGFGRVQLNGKAGLIDATGKELVSPQYNKVYKIKNYILTIGEGEKQGMYSLSGKELLPCEYTSIHNGKSENLFVTIKNGKKGTSGEIEGGEYGLYDLKNERQLLNEPYSFIGQVEEDLRVACKADKWGYLDSIGRVVIPFDYDKATSFKMGVAQVQKDGQSTMIPHPSKGTVLQLASTGVNIPVDKNIPVGNRKRENTFAFIVTCENYPKFNADYAVNDGRIFKEYCLKTLGIPETNIRMAENCSLGNLLQNLSDLRDIADVYDGDAEILFYFAGVGTKSETSGAPLMLLCDSELATAESSGYPLDALNEMLGKLPAKYVFAAIDAPFNGNGRDGKPLGEGRGVAIKRAQKQALQGNMVILTAAADGGDAISHESIGHGVMTYGLLEYLQANPHADSLDSLIDFAVKSTQKRSLELSKKVQKPEISMSSISSQIKY